MKTLEHDAVPSDPFLREGDGMVRTTSHVRLWGLTSLYRYRVVSTGLVPRSTMLGGTRYTRVWDLIPPRGT